MPVTVATYEKNLIDYCCMGSLWILYCQIGSPDSTDALTQFKTIRKASLTDMLQVDVRCDSSVLV